MNFPWYLGRYSFWMPTCLWRSPPRHCLGPTYWCWSRRKWKNYRAVLHISILVCDLLCGIYLGQLKEFVRNCRKKSRHIYSQFIPNLFTVYSRFIPDLSKKLFSEFIPDLFKVRSWFIPDLFKAYSHLIHSFLYFCFKRRVSSSPWPPKKNAGATCSHGKIIIMQKTTRKFFSFQRVPDPGFAFWYPVRKKLFQFFSLNTSYHAWLNHWMCQFAFASPQSVPDLSKIPFYIFF